VHDNSSVSQRSALVINGQNVFLEGLSLDGTLIVNAIDEAEVIHNFKQHLPRVLAYTDTSVVWLCTLAKKYFVHTPAVHTMHSSLFAG
jgi:hypothetical protein